MERCQRRKTIRTVLELVTAELFPLRPEEMKTGRGFGTQKKGLDQQLP